MRRSDCELPRLATEDFDLDVRSGLAGQQPREGEIDGPVENVIDLVEQQLPYRHLNCLMLFAERVEHGGEEPAPRGPVKGNRQLLTACCPRVLDHTLCLGEQAAAVGEQRLAGRCELDAATPPLEQ